MNEWLRSLQEFLGGLGGQVAFWKRGDFAETLSDLESEVLALSDEAGFPRKDLPSFGLSEDFARPHIEVNKSGYHFVVVERGQELERKTTRDRRELLYWIFDSVTFAEATRFEAANRIDGEDFRRQLFARQEQRLGSMDSTWGKKLQERHDSILSKNPFRDGEE